MEANHGDAGLGELADDEVSSAYHALYNNYEPKDARYLSLHTGHCLFIREDEKQIMMGDYIKKVCFTGTVDERADRVKAMRDMGYTEVTFVVVLQHPDAIDDWARVIQKAKS